MIVKRCTIEDIEAVYKIESESFADPMKKETMAKDLLREDYFCYGFFEDGLKAFVSYEKVFDEGQIISVATDKECRRQGFAKKLFNCVTDLAKKDGVAFFTLEVRSDNLSAINLYSHLGFVEVGRRKGYYKNPTTDAILMDLHLEKD